MNTSRPLIAVAQDGKPQEFASIDAFARQVGVSAEAAADALDEGKSCCGWTLYETPDNYRDRIARMKDRQVKAEDLMRRIRLEKIGI